MHREADHTTVSHAPLPSLDRVLEILRAHSSTMHAKGVQRLWVFGSVARQEATAESDVDLMVDIDPDKMRSLVAFASLEADLSDWLGVPVELAERDCLRTAIRAEAERDAIEVF
jgi:predicted nucleotidyltransferase